MTDRKKMIELIEKARNKDFAICTSHAMCKDCAYGTEKDCHSAGIADHLIANGVTFQRWIPVTDEQPDENATYIVAAFDGRAIRTTFAQWQPRAKKWYLTGSRSYWKVTHWMPLPTTPKGE